MTVLDDLTLISRFDKNNYLTSVSLLPRQCEQAWKESQQINFSDEYYNVKNIIISGMGGSTYGARIVKSHYDEAEITQKPIELANNYYLPGYVDKDTLVILSSYSGNTEETLNSYDQAREKKAKISAITSGGILGKLFSQRDNPIYLFDPKYNPSRQPRIGLGYMVIGLIGMLAKLKLIPVGEKEVLGIIKNLEQQNDQFIPSFPFIVNPAKQLAKKLSETIPVIIVSDFLEGAAYAVRNQLHETAKQFALYFAIPELNHHLLEGLSYPSNLNKNLIFIFINSSIYEIYDPRNIKRMNLTREVIIKNKMSYLDINLTAKSALAQTWELLQLFSWVTFYLAMLNKVDPSNIPYVDYFKKRLKGED